MLNSAGNQTFDLIDIILCYFIIWFVERTAVHAAAADIFKVLQLFA